MRPRREADMAALMVTLREVHDADAYPTNWPLDPARFLTPPGEFAAWVAHRNEKIIGHVGLRTGGSTICGRLASEHLNVTPEQVAVVTRLFVTPHARGCGAGEALLGAVRDTLRNLGLHGALDVDEQANPAIRLYERLGWRHVTTHLERYPGGEEFNMRIYLPPNRP